jgi:hypothetical protein
MKCIAPLSLAALSSALFCFSASPAVAVGAPTRASQNVVNSAGRIIEPIFAQFRPGLPVRPGAAKPTTVRYSRSATAGNMVTPAILLGMPIMVILALIIMAAKSD